MSERVPKLPGHAGFLAAVGEDFDADDGTGPAVTLTLVSCSDELRSGGYSSYSLGFRAPGTEIRPQSTFTLRHPILGTFAIFLVPTATDAAGTEYTAHFNTVLPDPQEA